MNKTSNKNLPANLNFDFNGNGVRVVMQGETPSFVGKDVCSVLGINKYRDAMRHLDDDARGRFKVDTLGGSQVMTAVSEPGLYSLIGSSQDAID